MIFCIIPALNEEDSIFKVVEEVKKYVDRVIVIDDGSDDKTLENAQKAGAIVIKHIVNRGQGAALETGNRYAISNKASVIVHFDADGQFLAKDIDKLVKPIKTGDYDVCIGSRFLGIDSKMPFFKKNVIFPIARFVNRVLFKIRLTDPQNGFRAFSSKVAESIHLNQDGSAHCSEFLYKVFNQNFKVKEIPVFVKYDEYGQGILGGNGRGMGGIKILKDLLLTKFIE